MQVNYAPHAYRMLSGVFAVYKPVGVNIFMLRDSILHNITKDLNLMKVRSPRKQWFLQKCTDDPERFEIIKETDWSDHPLVVGPRYEEADFQLSWLRALHRDTSGVCVVAINKGCSKLNLLQKSKLINVYRMKGRLGIATDDCTINGRIIQKTTSRHVTQAKIDKALAAVQAGHQRHMFLYAGVDIQSQAGYEEAAKGLVRPKMKSLPIIYNIKCISFQQPYFILEIHSLAEQCTYFHELMRDIGFMLKTSAVCAHLQCIRQGYFTLDHALLRKYWNAENIINAINYGRSLLTSDKIGQQRHLIKMPEGDQVAGYLEDKTNKLSVEDNSKSQSFLDFVNTKLLSNSS